MNPRKTGEGLEIIEKAKKMKDFIKIPEKQMYLIMEDYYLSADIDKSVIFKLFHKMKRINERLNPQF